MHLCCPQCATMNRVEAPRLPDRPVCGNCKQALLTYEPASLTAAHFDGFVAHTELPVVVDFWAAWCGPCQRMAPEFARAARNLAGRVQFAKVDTEASRELSARHRIRSIPTLLLFHHGAEIDRLSGALSAAELERWLLAR